MLFGRKSVERLSSCHEDIKTVLNEAIAITQIDFGVSEGYRTLDRQKELYDQGKSKIDGVNKKGKHNYFPSRAVDVYAYYDGKAQYDIAHMSYLAGLIMGIADSMYRNGDIDHQIRWGGNWDGDGKILIDQSFDDTPHFELI